METAISKLRAHMAVGDYRAALKLAAKWGRLGDARDAITAGWAALSNPKFYQDIGKNPQELIDAGIAAIRRRYNIT